jgi:hypothetical protein
MGTGYYFTGKHLSERGEAGFVSAVVLLIAN